LRSKKDTKHFKRKTPAYIQGKKHTNHLRALSAYNKIQKSMEQYNSNCHPRIVYPVKLSFNLDGEIGTFQDKGKLQ
jgi:hypothetical protein